jgi:hypothetical protein
MEPPLGFRLVHCQPLDRCVCVCVCVCVCQRAACAGGPRTSPSPVEHTHVRAQTHSCARARAHTHVCNTRTRVHTHAHCRGCQPHRVCVSLGRGGRLAWSWWARTHAAAWRTVDPQTTCLWAGAAFQGTGLRLPATRTRQGRPPGPASCGTWGVRACMHGFGLAHGTRMEEVVASCQRAASTGRVAAFTHGTACVRASRGGADGLLRTHRSSLLAGGAFMKRALNSAICDPRGCCSSGALMVPGAGGHALILHPSGSTGTIAVVGHRVTGQLRRSLMFVEWRGDP